MSTVTIPKSEYQKLIETKIRYERLRTTMEDDLFSAPPVQKRRTVFEAFKNTGLYNKEFLTSLERGLKRSSHFRAWKCFLYIWNCYNICEKEILRKSLRSKRCWLNIIFSTQAYIQNFWNLEKCVYGAFVLIKNTERFLYSAIRNLLKSLTSIITTNNYSSATS